ncbi:MAG: L,D-transpeptidase/peptidoglycan binding protein [Firmicutes bacterium]|nr:L,D-transpeptidase/peptidoglycan binding protein [Bacillota bacterium]
MNENENENTSVTPENSTVNSTVTDTEGTVGSGVKESIEESAEKGGAKNAAITAAMVIFALVLGYLLTGFLYFKTHFNPGTYIGGVSCAGQTVDSAINKMNSAAIDYKLTLTDGDKINESITAEDIGLKYNVSSKIDKVLADQQPLLWGAGFFRKNEVELENAFICDDEKVKAAIDGLDLVKNQQDTDPQNATLYYTGEEYTIVDGQHGGRIQKDKLFEAVESAAENFEDKVDLVSDECFEMPEYTAKSQKVIDACELANKYISPKITMNMGPGAEHVIIDKELISKWLFVTDNYDVFFDRNKVTEYVAEFAKTFNTYGQTREFLTAFGSRTTVKGGDFGWLIDQPAEVQSLVNVIKAGQDVVRYPVYSVMGVGHGNDDIGSSYVEVDLTNQHIYVWKDGKRVLDAPCVTGLPPKRITPPGTYRIKKKMSPAILVGDNYRTPVSYWMPFNRGIGLHDAVWQSSFGGKRYLTHGSHGCVNLSLSTARQVYGYVYPGMPVVCYYTNEVGVGKMMELPDFTTTTTTTTTESTTETTTLSATTTTKAPATTTTKAPATTTTKAPVPTTKAPATTTTKAPVPVTQAPPPVTQAPPPVTEAPVQPTTEVYVEQTTKKQDVEQDNIVITEPIVNDVRDDVIHEIVVE